MKEREIFKKEVVSGEEAETVSESVSMEEKERRKGSEGPTAEEMRDGYKATEKNIEERLEELRGEIEVIKEELHSKKNNFIQKIVAFKRIRALERSLRAKEDLRDFYEEDQNRAAELVAHYESVLTDEAEIEMRQKELDSKQETEERELVEKKEKKLEALSEKHDAFFVHDIIDAEWQPAENNKVVDTRTLTFADKVDLLLGLEPTISVSTLRQGNEDDRTFSMKTGGGSWGVFLKRGDVLGGAASDIGTVAQGLRDRAVPAGKDDLESIDNAIDKEHVGYNELVVENPQVGGIYVKWDFANTPIGQEVHLGNADGNIYDGWWDELKSVQGKGVPIFVLPPDNVPRMLHEIDFENRMFKLTPELDPKYFMEMPENIASEREGAVQRQIENIKHIKDKRKV